MASHMLDRTNPMGERPFIGRCRYCGTEGLRIEDALLDCPGAPGSGQALLDAIDGTAAADDDAPS